MTNGPIKASAVKLEKVKRIWHDRLIVGNINLGGGPSGKGKSLVTSKIAADISRGKGMPGGTPGAVIFSNREDARSIQRARIEAAGGDLDKVYFDSYLVPDDLARLEADVVKLGAKLIVMDTAAKHITAPIRNDQKVAQALVPLQEIAERTGCAVLLIAHTLKSVSRQGDPLLAFAGAVGGLVGTARSAFLFGLDPNNQEQRAAAWVKDSYAEPPKGMIFSIESQEIYDDRGRVASVAGVLTIDDKDADVNAIDLVASKTKEGEDSTPAKRANAAEWLTTKLQDGPVPAADLKNEAELDGVSWATIRRAQEDIGVEKPRDGFGKGSVVFWRLPFGHPALNPTATNKTPGGK